MGVVRYLGTNTVWAELQRVSSGLQRLSSGFLIFTKIPFQEKRSGMPNHMAAESTAKPTSEPRMALIGVARTAPTGATVVLNSGIVYYVHGMERWPDDVDGKFVTATGVIKTVAITPAGIDASSAPGVDVCVIREIDWKLMPSEPEPVPPPPAPLSQSPVQSPILLPTAGAISDDGHDNASPQHERPHSRRSRIGRISKEAFHLLTTSSKSHDGPESTYNPSLGMWPWSMDRTPPGPTARPPPAARVAAT